MPNYLFLFYYETPEQLRTNAICGTEAEEIQALLIEAGSEALALRCGIQVARARVKLIYEREACAVGNAWDPARYRHWVERRPHEKWSEDQLSKIPRVRAAGTLAREEFNARTA